MKTALATSIVLTITLSTLVQAQIGGDVNSIPPEHRAEYLRRKMQERGGAGIIERTIDGRRQQLINGRWQDVGGVEVPERIVNGVHQVFVNGQWQTVRNWKPVVPDTSRRQTASFAGRWQCSCGDTWDLSQKGHQITGWEIGSGGRKPVAGNCSGYEFIFRYTRQDGVVGYGILTIDSSGNRASGRILWSNGTTSSPALTRL